MFKKVNHIGKEMCVVNALSIAFDKSPDTVTSELKELSKETNADFKSETTWRRYLEQHGYHRVDIDPVPGKKRMTIKKLANISLKGITLVCKCPGHVVTIKDMDYYDEIDQPNLCVFWYYVK